ncbi:hypothetical protein [Caproiciproducens sp. CPB-2]|uniref:hypothetical protein n=1 Tax=unclassified Caproiciproducens TaxID=2643836 RepID=UPI0023DC60BA|nr:hypothetical protein [Caproiciproducens sp. CPB-2]MDF1494342.1 hypothetical protein [Caproiciproducens sp. CPB-2]
MQEPNSAYQNPAVYEDSAPLSIGSYLVMMLVGAIPVVGLVMMLVWAFSGSANTNRKNYARAFLIVMLIGVVLSIIFGAAFVSLLSSIGAASY